MSDRVAVILSGELRQIASPDQLYHDPDHLVVAQFVGTPRLNVLPATVVPTCLDLLGVSVSLVSGLPMGTRLQVGVRPERLAESVADAGLAGRLVYRENLGSDLFPHVALNGAAAPLIVRCDPTGREDLSLGDTVRAGVAAEHLLLFDLDGTRIRMSAGGGRRG